MNQEKLISLYKNYTNAKLLGIIENPVSYEAIAVEAARQELENRKLSPAQMEEAKQELAIKAEEKAARRKRRGELGYKFEALKHFLYTHLDPNQVNSLSPYRMVNIVSNLMIAILIFSVYKEFSLLKDIIFGSSNNWDLSVLSYFLHFIIIPIAAIMLRFRRRKGWYLSVFFFSNSMATAITMFFRTLYQTSTGFSSLDYLFPSQSPVYYVPSFFIFSTLTIILCQRNIRRIFYIDRKSMNITVLTSIGLVLIGIISFIL